MYLFTYDLLKKVSSVEMIRGDFNVDTDCLLTVY